jgi:hypothetical protein
MSRNEWGLQSSKAMRQIGFPGSPGSSHSLLSFLVAAALSPSDPGSTCHQGSLCTAGDAVHRAGLCDDSSYPCTGCLQLYPNCICCQPPAHDPRCFRVVLALPGTGCVYKITMRQSSVRSPTDATLPVAVVLLYPTTPSTGAKPIPPAGRTAFCLIALFVFCYATGVRRKLQHLLQLYQRQAVREGTPTKELQRSIRV